MKYFFIILLLISKNSLGNEDKDIAPTFSIPLSNEEKLDLSLFKEEEIPLSSEEQNELSYIKGELRKEVPPMPLSKKEELDLTLIKDKEFDNPQIGKDFVELKDQLDWNPDGLTGSKELSAWDLESVEEMKSTKEIPIDFEIELGQFKKLQKLDQNSNHKLIPLTKTQIQKKNLIEPEIFVTILKKNNIIEKIDTKEKISVNRDLYVRAIAKEVGGKTIYILDKKGNKAYLSSTNALSELNRTISMNPKPSYYQEYTPKAQTQSDDLQFKIDHYFSFVQETLGMDYYNTLFLADGPSASNSRFDYKTHFIQSWPINIGIGLGAQKGSWTTEEFQMDTFSAYYGLSLIYRANSWENKELEFEASISKLAFMKASFTGGGIAKFDGQVLELSGTTIFNTDYGNFLAGLTFSQTYLSVSSSDRPVNIENENNSSMSIGLKIGIKTSTVLWENFIF